MSEFIFNLQRFAEIYNSTPNTLVSGSGGDDYIENSGANVSIIGGKGNDYIFNGGDNVTIDAGADSDTVYNTSSNVTINGGDGDDIIKNINDDDYTNGSSNVSINGGAGNDTIYNEGGNNVLFNYNDGDGNDLIKGFNATSTLKIGNGTGSYSSVKSGSDIIVTVGEGEITLQGAAALSNLNIAGVYCASPNPEKEDGEYIENTNNDAQVTGTSGNDTIMNRGNLATILGGAGDDYVNMSANSGKGGIYVYTGGNDTVLADYWALNTIVLDGVSVESSVGVDYGHGTLYLSNGKTLDVYPSLSLPHVRVVSSMNEVPRVISVIDSNESFVSLTDANQKGTIDLISTGGDKVTITGDTSDYWILNTGTFGKITTGTGNDSIYNWGGNKSTISTGTGDDNISNSASNVSINSGTGNDFIEIRDGHSNVTVNAGDGNDDIYDEWGESNILIGGAGNDTFNAGKNSTVYAGLGDDRVDHPNYGGKVFLEDGNDLFYAYGETVHDDGTTLRNSVHKRLSKVWT